MLRDHWTLKLRSKLIRNSLVITKKTEKAFHTILIDRCSAFVLQVSTITIIYPVFTVTFVLLRITPFILILSQLMTHTYLVICSVISPAKCVFLSLSQRFIFLRLLFYSLCCAVVWSLYESHGCMYLLNHSSSVVCPYARLSLCRIMLIYHVMFHFRLFSIMQCILINQIIIVVYHIHYTTQVQIISSVCFMVALFIFFFSLWEAELFIIVSTYLSLSIHLLIIFSSRKKKKLF